MMANPKQSAVDLAKFIDKGVHVKLAGGREGEIYDIKQLPDRLIDLSSSVFRILALCY